MESRLTNWKKISWPAEIDVIRQLGVEIRCGVEIGKDSYDRRPERAGI